MRIAVLASNVIRIPPRPKDIPKGSSGATEHIVSKITEELVKRGHKVTLFASGDSKTKANLISITSKSTGKDPKIGIGPHESYEYALISKAYQMANEGKFDIIHSHFDTKTAYYAPLTMVPTVSTLHSPLDGISGIMKFFKNTQYYVSISNAQRKAMPDLNYINTIYHGLDLDDYPYGKEGGDSLIYVGRIAPVKGADTAVRIAKHLKVKLILLGWAKQKYIKFYSEKVKPFIDGKNIVNHGLITRKSMKEYLIHSKALIFPIHWEEPFGLVMIEAMATGTPVIAFARGSVPEVVKDGVTGFIVNSSESDKRGDFLVKKTGFDGLCEAVEKIYSMPQEEYKKIRVACRKHMEDNFTIDKMIDGYEKVFQQILAGK